MAQQRVIAEGPEQRLDRVQDHPLGADRLDPMPEADEQRLKVVLSSHRQLATINPNVVDRKLPTLDQTRQIPAERPGVLRQFRCGLLETHQEPGLAVLGDPLHQELQREQALASTRSTTDQRNPAVRKTTTGDLIQPADPDRTLVAHFDHDASSYEDEDEEGQTAELSQCTAELS